jgi:class 3 adenylate cyclase
MAEERRLVTVLFADVAGSTAMGESLDPEDVRVLMGRYFELARTVVEEHGGIVEKFIGDAVMAVFGVPQAHGDDAERAVSAALALQDGLAAVVPESSFRARVGVNTGEVVATGDVSRHEFLVTGDTVNTAARLQQGADPGQVLVGERTHRAARNFSYGRPLDLDAKGKQQPLRAWPALGRGSADRAISRVPFLGREADLQQLHLIAARAFTERRPHLVTLTAPAGTGKSRLLEEFQAQLPDRYPGLRVATAQCVPYGQTLTYWPMRAILTSLAGIDRAASGTVVRERLATILDEPDGTRDADLIAMTVAPEEGHEQRNRDQIFAAWRHLLERQAASGPLLLVFEDLHWAADSLLDLVDNLMQPRTGAPLLVVSIARPELIDRRPAWGGGRRNYMHLALEPLGDEQIARLVELLMEGTPPSALRQLVVERAGGNPFFATELARAIVDQGVLARAKDGQAPPVLALPETVHATILSRLDLLEERERRVLQAGAVMGRTFRPSMLAEITGLEAAAVHAALESLLDRELVVVAGPDDYAFAHILIRDVAYQTLPRVRRAQDHAVIARLLETLMPERLDQLADLIALHYLEASRLRRGLAFAGAGGGDDEALRRAAIYWLSRAARSGAAAGATAEAVRQLSDAISLATPEEEMLLQEQLGEAFAWGDDALSAFQRAVDLWRNMKGDPTTGARLLGHMITVYQRWQGSYSPQRRPATEQVRQLNDEALALAQRSGDEQVMATVLSARSFFPFFSGDRSPALLETAQRDAIEARTIFERLDLPQQLSGSLDAVQSMAIECHDFEGALAASQKRLEFFDRIADGIERLDSLTMVASNVGHLGRVDEGLTAARLARTLSAVGRPARVKFHALSYLILLDTICGEWDEALAVAREGIAFWEAEGRPYLGIPHRNFAAGLYVARRRGRLQDAADIRNFLTLTILTSASADPRAPIAFAYVRAVTDEDPSLAAQVLPLVESVPSAISTTERALALLAASQLAPVTAARVEQLLSYADAHQLKPVTAHLLRMRSQLRGGDGDDLRRAHQLLDASIAVHDAALARLDLFALTREPELLDKARRDLTHIGDEVGLQRALEVEASRG